MWCVSLYLFIGLAGGFHFIKPAQAEDSLCSTVKIEILQEMTLERQAFEAHMRITNGHKDLSLTEVEVNVLFKDSDGEPVPASYDPDDTSALFFLRVDEMDGVDAIDGAGTVVPEGVADIYWLIIPAPGARW